MKPKLWMGIVIAISGIAVGTILNLQNVVFLSALVLVGTVVGLKLKSEGFFN